MTSGIFQQTPISSIIVNRSERQRRELPDLTELKKSIAARGLIHPIVVTHDLVLVAGECRLTSCRELGWSHISTQFVDDLDPEVHHLIELEENVKRNELPWQDQCRAVAEYHRIRLKAEPEWAQSATAEALGMSQAKVAERLMVVRELEAGNKLVAEAPKYSTARGIAQRAESRKAEVSLAAISRPTSAMLSPEPEEERSILNADFNEWAKTYDGPKFNFLHCDFPYGIGADSFNQGAAASHGGYDDSESTYFTLLASLASNLERVCAPSCHIMFWYSLHYHTETLKFFAEHTDFAIDPFPLIWTKSDNVGILPDPSRGPRRIYETCLFGSRGDRKIVRTVSNSVAHSSERDIHMSIKPQAMLEQFFGMFVDGNTLMLDPTCGSGSSLRAAEARGAQLVVGLERDADFAERANAALNKARAAR